MKVLAINGSVRKDGNTSLLINMIFDELRTAGIETEQMSLGANPPKGCIACYKCFDNKDNRCDVKIDKMNDFIEKMVAADGIILASPTYFADVSTGMKALIERAGMVARANDNMLKRKVGAAVVAVRRGGAIHTFDTLTNFFLISEMIVAGSSYWNLGIGRNPGDVLADDEGVRTMKTLGQNMSWLMKKLNA